MKRQSPVALKRLLLALFAGLFIACQMQDAPFRSVSAEQFATLIADPAVQRLDVRTVAEYSEGHIPGSINLNVLDESFASMADSVLQRSTPVALYCRSGKRSKKAAKILADKGYEVIELDKGFQAWTADGLPVEH